MRSASATASPSPTAWTVSSVTISNEDTSVWTQNDERIKKDSSGPNGTIDGYTVNADPSCFGFIASEAKEKYYDSQGAGDKAQPQAGLKSQQKIFSGYQTTQGPSIVETVRDDDGIVSGYVETLRLIHGV